MAVLSVVWLPSGYVLWLRTATWRDVWRLWRWRNDASTRAISRTAARVGLCEHVLWFCRTRERVCVAMVSADGGDEPVGTCRLSPVVASESDVSLVVAPEHRGHGYGVGILRCVEAVVDADRLVGVVRVDNRASIRTFERAGYALAVEPTDTDRWLVFAKDLS